MTLALIVTTFVATLAIVKYLPGVRCINMRWENMTFALFVQLKRLVEYWYQQYLESWKGQCVIEIKNHWIICLRALLYISYFSCLDTKLAGLYVQHPILRTSPQVHRLSSIHCSDAFFSEKAFSTQHCPRQSIKNHHFMFTCYHLRLNLSIRSRHWFPEGTTDSYKVSEVQNTTE